MSRTPEGLVHLLTKKLTIATVSRATSAVRRVRFDPESLPLRAVSPVMDPGRLSSNGNGTGESSTRGMTGKWSCVFCEVE